MKKSTKKAYLLPDKEEPLNAVSEPALAYRTYPLPYAYGNTSDMDVLKVIKKGVPKKILDKTMDMMGFSLDEMSGVLHISERTLRRYDERSILNTEQSERIIELNNLYAYGSDVFSSLQKFKLWVDSPVLALGNKKPKEFLDTSLGISIIRNILGRIEYGVYS